MKGFIVRDIKRVVECKCGNQVYLTFPNVNITHSDFCPFCSRRITIDIDNGKITKKNIEG